MPEFSSFRQLEAERTELQFAGFKRNPSFAKGTFTYAPPKGVDVVSGG